MNIVIPMAGRGSRLRPHTLTVPKPLVPVAGKPIVQRLVEDIVELIGTRIEHIGFVIGDFGEEVEQELLEIAGRAGAEGHIFYQEKPLGTADAILCARDLLQGNVVVAFADTLFKAKDAVNTALDGVIWVHQVEDPRKFGVVKLDNNKIITDFHEKPEEFISDLAIIGIYYFKDGEYLRNELQYLIDNDIKEKGEYQLTNALENMKQKGTQFGIASVAEWLDCGNKNATVYTNQRILEFSKEKEEELTADDALVDNSIIIEPCYIGSGCDIKDSVIGPHVSVGKGTIIERSVISNSLIQNNSHISHKIMDNSMIGNQAKIKGKAEDLSLGDFSEMG